jgi:L-malate glycosyltransferase
MLLAMILIVVAGWIGRRRRPIGDEGCEIMLTGRFDSDNWILAHLGPLAHSKECSCLWMVSTNPVPVLPKIVAIYPPRWLMRTAGATPARLLTFAWAVIRKRPHVVGGFHLIYNGIAAAIVARLAGARSMYFCVGGTEVPNDGIYDESNCFLRTKASDDVVRNRRLRIISSFDTIVTMGTRAAKFFQDSGMTADILVVSGGINGKRFYPAEEPPSIDCILTGRLTAVKRIDVFLQAIRIVVDRLPEVKIVVMGDGESRAELQRLAVELSIDLSVNFVGNRDDVEDWLRRSKVFVLTSDLEGLPLSAMEAMMCGLPAIVSDVGDLGDLVEDGVNGYLVPRRSPEKLAARIIELLSDERKLGAFSKAAHRSALRYEIQATAGHWDRIITRFRLL